MKPLRDMLLLALVGASLTACAPRQAIIASDPPAGGPVTGVGDGPLMDDLTLVVEAQDAYFKANGVYADRSADLNLTPTEGVSIDIIQGDRNGFSAIARSGDFECAVYVGDVRAPRSYLTDVAEVGCRS